MADKAPSYVEAPANASLWNSSAWSDVQQSCWSHKTCDECLNSSYACHFCAKDFQCHAIGSPSGCLTGISQCHHLEDCERKEPQYVGYGPPPSVVIAVLCLVVTLTCCLCGMSAICSVFLRSSTRRSERANRRTGRPARALASPTTHLPTVKEQLSPQPDEPLLSATATGEPAEVFEDDDSDIVVERLRVLRERESGLTWGRFIFRVCWIGVLIIVTVLALMFYPRMPDYNVCNREFEWESILHSLMSLTPKIEYDALISVINENRFGFVLEKGRADIYHNQTWIGQWVLNQTWEAKAGSISDVIAPIKLNPGFKEGWALWNDFSKNELIFRINASITGSITWGKYKVYRISSSVADIEFLVGAEYDRGLCKCTEYLEPQ